MALLEEVFKREGAAGSEALGIGASLFAPSVLGPVAKEVIKAGIVPYDEDSGAVSGAYEAAGNLVAVARAERESDGVLGDGEGTRRRVAHPNRRSGVSHQERGDDTVVELVVIVAGDGY